MVSQSAVERGVVNVIRWMQSTPKGSFLMYPTFEDACSAAEAYRGVSLPDLRRLLAEAKADLAAHVARAAKEANEG